MGGAETLVSSFGHAAAALCYAVFAVYLSLKGYWRRRAGAAQQAFVLAVAATAAWSTLALLEPQALRTAPSYLLAGLDLVRYAAWFGFLLLTLRQSDSGLRGAFTGPLAAAVVAIVALGAMAVVWRITQGLYTPGGSRLYLFAALALAVLGLVLVEQLFRSLPTDSRWNAKPVCLGLAIVFAYDLYLFSSGVLLGDLDPDALSIRAAVHLLAVPLFWLATRRRTDWIQRLQVSRSAAFHSATLLLVGGYLLFMSAVGYYVRYFGGEWGRALQLALGAAAIAALFAMLFSGAMRARLRVFVGKHFFSYRYDYREEWLRFTAMLSSRGSPQEVGGFVVRGLAAMVECPAGSLWTRTHVGDDFRQTARWNQPAVEVGEPTASSFCEFMLQQSWIIDLDEYRNAPRRYGQMAVPSWLLGMPDAWLVVPLPSDESLLGFVVLARPRTPMTLNWEVRDLLKTASRQAAGFLAQMQATEALLEARKFEAFNRMSAFVVHDLKNIVTQLSLMMKNAQRLHANPEFQQDMLLTVDSSLEKMRRLMLQLREGATPPGGAHGVELAPILQKLSAMAEAAGRSIEIEQQAGLATRGHAERMERVLGHLVQNALDATQPTDRIWVRAARHSGQVQIEVGDTGSGMSEDFVRNRLFRPFSTSKDSGMGIGAYESFQYVQELGGTIEVTSEPGKGTRMVVSVPRFERQAGSDLQ